MRINRTHFRPTVVRVGDIGLGECFAFFTEYPANPEHDVLMRSAGNLGREPGTIAAVSLIDGMTYFFSCSKSVVRLTVVAHVFEHESDVQVKEAT